MQGWALALLLKWLVAIALFAVVFGGARLLMLAMRRFVPNGWVKRWLFSDSWGKSPDSAAGTTEGGLHNPPLLSGDAREDRSRL